jgi:hypothetical protein
VDRIFHFSHFDPYYPTSGLTVAVLAEARCIITQLCFSHFSLLLLLPFAYICRPKEFRSYFNGWTRGWSFVAKIKRSNFSTVEAK